MEKYIYTNYNYLILFIHYSNIIIYHHIKMCIEMKKSIIMLSYNIIYIHGKIYILITII